MDILLLFVTVGAGALAFWSCVRFADRGAHSVLGSCLNLLLATALANLAVAAVPAAVSVPQAGLYLAIFGLVLPTLTYMILCGMWIVRSALSGPTRELR